MRQNGTARIALIVALAVSGLSIAMLLSSSAFGGSARPGSRNDTCVPILGTPCLPGGSSSASPSKASPSSTSPGSSPTSPSGGSSFKSHISIGFVRGSFKGRVRSTSSHCVGGRSVVLYEIHHRKGSPVGHDTTDRNGHWKVSHLSDVHGKFYASVKRAQVNAGTCQSAKSKTVSR